MTALPVAAVVGLGVWTPGFPNVRAWHDGVHQGGAELPPARLPVRLRRRTSLLIRMVAEVSAQAAEEARVSLGEVPVIVGSAFGELTTTMEMLHELATERAISPFRFHNSVHNTASGYLSIANANRLPATSVAAGDDTVSMVVLEALTLLAERGGRVLVVVADEALPTTMSGQRTQPLAAAMVLGAPGGSSEAPTLAHLVELRRAVELGPEAGAAPTPTRDRAVDDDGPCLPLLRLCAAALDARTLGRPTRVELTAGATPRWSIEVRP